MMGDNFQPQKTKHAYTGLGIAFGPFIGILIGQLFLDGNIAEGIAIGLPLGLMIGVIADMIGRRQSEK